MSLRAARGMRRMGRLPAPSTCSLHCASAAHWQTRRAGPSALHRGAAALAPPRSPLLLHPWRRGVSSAAQTTGATKTCWHCREETGRASVFCENARCGAVQPVDSATTYYNVLLDRPPTFHVDVARLRRSFLKLQQSVHPDIYARREKIESRLAAAQSVWVNAAYATLKDPLRRARYLLRLHGRDLVEDEQVSDPELLMEIMESREALEAATTEARVAELRQHNSADMARIIADLGRAFDAGDLDDARRLTQRLQYVRRVAQAIDGWEPGKPVVVGH